LSYLFQISSFRCNAPVKIQTGLTRFEKTRKNPVQSCKSCQKKFFLPCFQISDFILQTSFNLFSPQRDTVSS
jgi:hypothetical protein